MNKRIAASCQVVILALALGAIETTAHAGTYRQCGTVADSVGPVDGQNHDCGYQVGGGWPWNPSGTVQCATVTVQFPANETPVSYVRTISPDIGWTMWLDEVNISQNSASTRLKNWSHNTPRSFCLTIETQ